jgi:hypothetical protein
MYKHGSSVRRFLKEDRQIRYVEIDQCICDMAIRLEKETPHRWLGGGVCGRSGLQTWRTTSARGVPVWHACRGTLGPGGPRRSRGGAVSHRYRCGRMCSPCGSSDTYPHCNGGRAPVPSGLHFPCRQSAGNPCRGLSAAVGNPCSLSGCRPCRQDLMLWLRGRSAIWSPPTGHKKALGLLPPGTPVYLPSVWSWRSGCDL